MQHSFVNGWAIRRFDTIFRIYAFGDGGSIIAEAEFNPLTMELQTLWDDFSETEFTETQFAHEGDWRDDVLSQLWDPNIRLQR